MTSQRRNQQRSGTASDSSERSWGSPTALRTANRQALRLLDEWLSEPDDLGDEWWDAFERELRDHRLSISRSSAALPDSGMTT